MERKWFNSMLFNSDLEYRCGLTKSIDSFGPIENNGVNEDLSSLGNEDPSCLTDSENSSSSNGDYLVDVSNIHNFLSHKIFSVKDSNSNIYDIYYAYDTNDTKSNWTTNLNGCIESYLRSQIWEDSDKYNASERDIDSNSDSCDKVKNSIILLITSPNAKTRNDPFAIYDTNDMSDTNDTNDISDTNDLSDTNDTNDIYDRFAIFVSDIYDTNDTNDTTDISDTNDTNDTNDISDTNDTNNIYDRFAIFLSDILDTNDISDTNDTNDISDTSDTNDISDTSDTNDISDTNDTNDTNDISDTNDTNDISDTNDTSDTNDIYNIYDIYKTYDMCDIQDLYDRYGEVYCLHRKKQENTFVPIDYSDPEAVDKLGRFWVACETCYGMNFKKFFPSKMCICEFCDEHLKMSSSDRIELSIDPGTWNPMDEDMISLDPIEFDVNEEDGWLEEREIDIKAIFFDIGKRLSGISNKSDWRQQFEIEIEAIREKIREKLRLSRISNESDDWRQRLEITMKAVTEEIREKLRQNGIPIPIEWAESSTDRPDEQIVSADPIELDPEEAEKKAFIDRLFEQICSPGPLELDMEAIREEIREKMGTSWIPDPIEFDSEEESSKDRLDEQIVSPDPIELDSEDESSKDRLDEQIVSPDPIELDSEEEESSKDRLDEQIVSPDPIELDSEEEESSKDRLDEQIVSPDPIELDSEEEESSKDRPDEQIVSPDPIELDSEEEEDQSYIDRLLSYQESTELPEAVQTGTGQLNGIPLAIAVMDSEFIAGSMGSVVGEKITRLIEYATNQLLPLIIVCASGGARMQEGSLSLMQMAKISSALYNYQINQKLFYVAILTSPTTGGVTASFGMLGDIIIAEPNATIAFAGQRVIEQLLNVEVPEGSQSADLLFDKGLLDSVVPRHFLKQVLTELLQFHGFVPLTENSELTRDQK